jgi:hypothetical protein
VREKPLIISVGVLNVTSIDVRLSGIFSHKVNVKLKTQLALLSLMFSSTDYPFTNT